MLKDTHRNAANAANRDGVPVASACIVSKWANGLLAIGQASWQALPLVIGPGQCARASKWVKM
jgi:hypothetical protein